MDATLTKEETTPPDTEEETEKTNNKVDLYDTPHPSSSLQLLQSLPNKDAATTLEGRLLCAARVAYNIANPYFRAASYLPHTTAKRISRSINSVLIGRTIDGIVLSFRGTIFNSTLDWIQNAATLLSPGNKKDDIPGSIHVGFYRAVKSLWGGLKNVVLELLQEEETDHRRPKRTKQQSNVYLTGHSKGGAMASIAAYLMYHDGELPNPTSVVTFGSARVGDEQFKLGYEKVIQQITFENDLDLVPFLPPSNTDRGMMDEEMKEKMDSLLWPKGNKNKHQKYIWGYQPIGTRKYIQNNGTKIVDDTNGSYDAERIRIFEEKTILSYKDFIEAHKCDCSGGYFRAVAPEVCDGQEKLKDVMDGMMVMMDEKKE